MIDLQGRHVKTSKDSEPKEGLHFELGATAYLTANGYLTTPSKDTTVQVDSKDLPKAVRPGDIISFNDGDFGAVVLEVAEDSVRVQFKEEGVIEPNKTIRIPGHRLASLPILTQEDKDRIIELAVGFKMDYICVPNVTSVKDI